MRDYERLLPVGQANTTRTEQLFARRQLKRIGKALLGLSQDEIGETPITCDAIKICSRSRVPERIVCMFLQDGVGLLYTTEGFLENRSHRFIFPDDGEPSYHREAFNVDCQAIDSPSVNAEGMAALVADKNIINQINFVSRFIETEQMEFKKVYIPTTRC